MASNQIVFSAIKTHSNVNQKLEQDANGYYKVILGAINAYNQSGDFYLADGVKDLIENDSYLLARRLKNGYLTGEMGHPQLLPGMTKAQFYARNLRIDMANESHHIRDIILTPSQQPSGMKGNVINIEGWVKPSGQKGEALKRALDNPDQNVSFSIRALTLDSPIPGGTGYIKKLTQIITWDWVTEPGIRKANKWSTLAKEELSVESRDLFSWSVEEFENMDLASGDLMGISNENAAILNEGYNEAKSIISPKDRFAILKNW